MSARAGEPAGPVLVQGPGAIGRLIAARLARAGIAVELLGRGGAGFLDLTLIEGDAPAHRARVPLRSIRSPGGHLAETWIIATKAYDVGEALVTGRPHVATRAPVLILSNGFGHDESLIEHAGARPALLGTIACGARAEGAASPDPGGTVEGTVRALGEGPVRLGPSGEDSARAPAALEALGALLRRAGFVVETVADGRAAQWEKAALNCGLNPVAALLGVPNGELPATPWFRWSVEAAREAAGVARASGLPLPERGWRDRLASLCESTARNRCSMLQDLEAGRRLEIDQLNGWVATRARRLHIPAPRNRRLAQVLSSEQAQQLLRLQRMLRVGSRAQE